MPSSYVIAGCRTPIGKLLGRLSSVPATELGAICVREALARAAVAADAGGGVILGCEADYIAAKCQVSRADQDAFAAQSHQRALAAARSPQSEIVSVSIRGPKGETVVREDEGPRADTSVESLSRLRLAFGPEGTVT